MARSAWLRLTSAGFFAGSLVFLFLGGCFVDVGTTAGKCEDDGNVCTQDLCDANGANPTHPAVPNPGSVKCLRGDNEGICTDKGECDLACDNTVPSTCVCSDDSACAKNDPCATWGCMSGKCAITAFAEEGKLVDPLEDGDCQWTVCRSGAPVQEAHNDEIPPMPDTKGDCVKPECVAGEPKYDVPDTADPPADTDCKVFSCGADGMIQEALAPVGKKCGQNMDMACDKDGMCVSCLPAGKDDYEKCKMNSPMMVCPVPKCEGQPCTNKDECKSECTDGVCCENTCTGECKACNVPGMVGKCTNVPYYEEDSSYIEPEFMSMEVCTIDAKGTVCNGAGKCQKVIGKACTVDGDCVSGKCNPTSPKICLGAKGEACSSNASCISGTCNNMGKCD